MRRRLINWRAAIATALAVLLTVLLLPATASAATPGITATVLLNGQTYDGTPVVNEGDEVTLRVQYNTDVRPGSTVTFDIGANVTVTGVPPTSTAIEAVTQVGNQVAITFRDPWPAGVNQGVFDLRFTVNNVDSSTPGAITWEIDSEQSSVDVIVRDDDDQFATVTEAFAKSVTPGNLDSLVTVVDGQVKLRPEIVDRDLTYTLRLDSPQARSGYAIADQLPVGMSYVADSFAAELVTWDANGLNRTTTPFAFSPSVTGTSFATTVDVPGPSVLTATYRARITDVAVLEALLQAKYDALGGSTGRFEHLLTNTATFGATSRSASVRLRGTVPGVNLGRAFAKNADWSTKNVVTGVDGRLAPPAEIVYTFTADLRQWTGGPNFSLDRNVVISDVLPEQASWITDASDFVTASGITLTPATREPADDEDFAGDEFVGQYWVDGQRLLVNVGQDNKTNATIAVKAQLDTVVGLTQTGTTPVVDATPYRWRNVADFHYRDGSPYRATRDVTVVVLPTGAEGTNDPTAFTKSGTARQATVEVGETVTVDYAFVVAAGKGIDPRTSTIVDYVDTDVFDLSNPEAMAISGTYGGQPLGAAHFALGTDAAGNLTINLSIAGAAVVTMLGADREYRVDLALTTKPFEGKQTRTITNKAILFGADDDPLHWSETETEATSYGDEAEVRKRVYDSSAGEWVESLRAPMDGTGHLVQDTYVYRIEFIPHGSYDAVAIIPVVDVLPDAVDFLGFVDEADAATGANPTSGPVDIGGNLVASHDAASGAVTIAQKGGTVLAAGAPIAAYVAVRVNDASAPIVNQIGGTSAEIVPLRSVSVGDVVWVDSDRDGRQGEGEPGIPGVVLALVGPDGEPVTGVDGKPVGSTTTGSNGEYTFDGLPALTGDETYTVRIDQDASAEALAGYVPTVANAGDRVLDSSTWEAATVPGELHEDGDRDPTLDFGFVTKTYAIGDLVWIDVDKDGMQSAGESPLVGVGVELLDPDGNVLGTTVTDDDGRYVFDGLPAGTYQVRFTLTAEQEATYEFATRDAGSDDAVDSDANPADGLTVTVVLDDTNEALTRDYEYRTISATQGVDPTWDAGVVLTAVAPEVVVDGDTQVDDPTGGLPSTGLFAGLGSIIAAVLLVMVGTGLLRAGRRTSAESGAARHVARSHGRAGRAGT